MNRNRFQNSFGAVLVSLALSAQAFGAPTQGIDPLGITPAKLCASFVAMTASTFNPKRDSGCGKVKDDLINCGVGTFCAGLISGGGAVPAALMVCLTGAVTTGIGEKLGQCTAEALTPTCCDMNSTKPGQPIPVPSSGPMVDCTGDPDSPFSRRVVIKNRCNQAVTGHCVGKTRCKSNCDDPPGGVFGALACPKACKDWVEECVNRCR